MYYRVWVGPNPREVFHVVHDDDPYLGRLLISSIPPPPPLSSPTQGSPRSEMLLERIYISILRDVGIRLPPCQPRFLRNPTTSDLLEEEELCFSDPYSCPGARPENPIAIVFDTPIRESDNPPQSPLRAEKTVTRKPSFRPTPSVDPQYRAVAPEPPSPSTTTYSNPITPLSSLNNIPTSHWESSASSRESMHDMAKYPRKKKTKRDSSTSLLP